MSSLAKQVDKAVEFQGLGKCFKEGDKQQFETTQSYAFNVHPLVIWVVISTNSSCTH
jgi:hypothetical protein